jgi:hypothetical protein
MHLPIDCISMIAAQAPLITRIQMERAFRGRKFIPSSFSSKEMISEGFERSGIVPVGRGHDLYNVIFPNAARDIWIAGEFLLWIIHGVGRDEWSAPPRLQIYTSIMVSHLALITRLAKFFQEECSSIQYRRKPRGVSTFFRLNRRIDVIALRSGYTLPLFFEQGLPFSFTRVYYTKERGLRIKDVRSVLKRDCILRPDYYLNSMVDLTHRMDEQLLHDEAKKERTIWEQRGYSFRFKRINDDDDDFITVKHLKGSP